MSNNYSFLLLGILAIYLVQGSSSDLTEEEKQRLKPQPAHIEQCKEGYPYLGVGDFNLTDANFSTTIKGNKAVLVIVTAKWCDYCCKFEEIFADLRNDILSNKTLLHGLDIKLARATVENNPKVQDLVSKLPEFIFYYKEEPFVFEHSFEVSIVGSILSKIIRPYRVLNSPSELQEFMENDIIIQKGDHHFPALKIIGIYSKEDDLKDELKEFKSLTDQYCIYQDLQFALITKESVISPIYREKRLVWFPEYMRSTILLVDRRNKVHKIDPTLNSDQMGNQIHLKGKEPVEQLTTETQELFRRMKQPMLISFVDTTKGSLRSYLDMLTEVAKQFQEHINFAYMDNAQNANKRELLGIYHDKVPAIGINFPNDPNLYPYPEEQEITKTNLIKFIMDFLDRKLVPLDPKSQANRPSKNASKHPIYKYLTNAVEVKFADFNELVLKEGTDVALLLFNPSDEQNLELFCKNYDKMAERFKALSIKSVRIAFYDLTNNPPPPSIQVFTSPMLVFLPAYQKQPPFKIYTDTPKTLPLMLYIEKYADVRFKLPDLPHLPPELHEAYYQQKKQMEEEKLNREKKDISDDDVIVAEPKIDPVKRVVMDEL